MYLFLLTFILIAIYIFLPPHWRFNRSKLPPGPFPWPIVGNVPQIDPINPWKTFEKWTRKYGPIFTYWVGWTPNISVTGYDEIKEMLIKNGDRFLGRPRDFLMNNITKGNYGISLTSGQLWREQRRYALFALQNFVFTRSSLEEKTMNEMRSISSSIIQKMAGQKKIQLNLIELIEIHICALFLNFLSGRNVDAENDEQFHHFLSVVEKNSNHTANLPKVQLLDKFPLLRHIPLFGHFGLDQLNEENDIIYKFVDQEVKNCREKYEDDAEVSDFITAFTKEMKKRKENGEDLASFTEWQLLQIVFDIYHGGAVPVMAALKWLFLAMIKYPRVQEKAFTEIDRVIGRDRSPTLSDRTDLPYVTAVLYESLRWGNITPGVFNYTSDTDTTIGSHVIPKNVNVLPIIAAILWDENLFSSPEQFRPERFLENDGTSLKKIDQFVPFSIGKRHCVGESAARSILFFVFVHVLQNFHIEATIDCGELNTNPVFGVAVAPRPYECVIHMRQ